MLKIIGNIVFFLLLTSSLKAQIIIGTVTDSEYTPLIKAEIKDTLSKKSILTDSYGGFSLEITNNSILEISHPEFATQLFPVKTKQQSDTIYLNFVLTEKVQLTAEVTITSERLKRVVDQKDINVIDYLPFDEYILVLKSHKSKRILSLESVNTTITEFDLGQIKAKSLFEDCYGNTHLLSQDSSYQIWIDSTFHVVSRNHIDKFNKLLKSCVSNFSENIVFYNFTNRNRKYTLTSINKKSKRKNYFFHLHDKIGEKHASTLYTLIINYYHQKISGDGKYREGRDNMIELGVWDGNLLSLNLYDIEFERMITWYSKIRAVELNIQAFQSDSSLIVFDQFSDSIHIFNEQNDLLKSTNYSFVKGSTVYDVIQDRSNNVFYERTIKDGVYTLSSLNHLYNDEVPKRQVTISEVPFATNIKVFNNWIYFTVKENNFYGLYKLKIPVAPSD